MISPDVSVHGTVSDLREGITKNGDEECFKFFRLASPEVATHVTALEYSNQGRTG